MDLRAIRTSIKLAITEEERGGALVNKLDEQVRRAGSDWAEQDRASCMNYIRDYVADTPLLMEATHDAATEAGVIDRAGPLFEALLAYWYREDDLIPDELGLAGLVDDAYLSHCLVQLVADAYAEATDGALLSWDLEDDNAKMRALIGDEIAEQLDAIVTETFALSSLQDSVSALTEKGGAFGATVTMDPATARATKKQFPGVCLGALAADARREEPAE